MNIRNVVSILSILALAFVYAEEPAPEQNERPDQAHEELTAEQKEALSKFLALQESPEKSGKWQKEGESLVCDGFLTRVENDDHCAAEVPSDWRPFEFNGKTYYVQPLT